MMRDGSQFGILRQMRLAMAAVAALIAGGSLGYMAIEGCTLLDAFYMTVITVFTVGFREVFPLSPAGQLFTSLLIMFGVGIALWAGASLLELALSHEAQSAMRRRRMKNTIAQMKDHHIICGYGRIGREVCRTLCERGVPHVIGDTHDVAIEELREGTCPFIQGDCSDDETLRALGIERAQTLIAVTGTDAENTFIVLTARALDPELYIVARAAEPEAESKIRAAGANKVITPYQIGGQRIAAAAYRPNITDFLEVAMKGDVADLAMDEVLVGEGSPLADKTVVDSGIRAETGAFILAIKRADGHFDSNPSPETVVRVGDILIALGTCDQLGALSRLSGA